MWAEIDLGAVEANVRTLLGMCAPGTKLIAVVKANAYGHGAAEIAHAALRAGAWGLAVARVEEGVELRRAGVAAPVLVMGYAPDEALPAALEHNLTLTMSDLHTSALLSTFAAAAGRTADVHLEVDTGMHRYGVDIADAPGVVEALSDLPGVRLAGMYTHYASADATDTRVFDRQLEAFTNLVSELQQRGLRPEIVHASNSPALHSLDSCFDAVRPGIALYGVRPSSHWSPSLRPVMAVKAHVGRVFDVRAGEAVSYGGRYVATHAHRAAVIACGYADGYMRSLSGRGEVLLHGRRCRVLGTVCMDSFVVGLPDGLEAAPGDEAVVLGAQGEERVSAEELAERAGTIAYELLCGMCRRGSRIYLRPAG